MNGRWPSNFLLTHSPGCVKIGVKRVKNADCKGRPSQIESQGQVYGGGQHNTTYADTNGLETIDDFRCVENCPVRRLGEQSGKRKSGARMKDYKHRGMIQAGHAGKNIQTSRCEASEGTAARFFFQADWSYERIEEEELWQRGK